MTKQRLPRPESIDSDIWVDEAIWGHRLYDEQTPWLCFLEFLSVLQSEMSAGRPLTETTLNSLNYSPFKRMYLRNILFNNPRIKAVIAEHSDEDSRWKEWLIAITKNAAGIGAPNFTYLRSQFDSFADFAAVVDFLRSTSIEGDSNKRWSSKFVFPYGPSSFYEDLNVRDNHNVTNDRRFFARTGELLYLMIARSGRAAEIVDHLRRLVFDPSSKWDRLVACLQPGEEKPEGHRPGAYLPYKELPEFGELAADWIRVLSSGMPGYDCIPHLVNLTGLHLIRYVLARARDTACISRETTFVLEIIAPKKTVVRDLAAQSFTDNNSLTRHAILAHVRRVSESPAWKTALVSSDAVGDAALVLRSEFSWPTPEDDISGVTTPSELLEELCDKASNRHKQHLDKFHSAWGREIGLSSRRGSRRTRYAPTDSFLKTLVYCNVEGRLEFGDFLELLFRKYGFVIGDHQGTDLINSSRCDRDALSENARRLEMRLVSMGLLKRLSDACAYVENPFAPKGQS